MFLGYLIDDHRGIERDHEGTLGAFCEKGDVGCKYSVLQGARPLLVNDVHPIRIAIKRDSGVKMSLDNHGTKSLHALLCGFGASARESSIRVTVDCRNFVQSLSIDCGSKLGGCTVTAIEHNFPLFLESHSCKQFSVLSCVRRLKTGSSSVIGEWLRILQAQSRIIVESLPEHVEHLEPVILWRVVASSDHYSG